MGIVANITGPTGPPGPTGPAGSNILTPSSYDAASITYSGDVVDHVIYSLSSVQIQRVDFTYLGDQIQIAVVKSLPSNAVIRTVTYIYTGDSITSWTVT